MRDRFTTMYDDDRNENEQKTMIDILFHPHRPYDTFHFHMVYFIGHCQIIFGGGDLLSIETCFHCIRVFFRSILIRLMIPQKEPKKNHSIRVC